MRRVPLIERALAIAQTMAATPPESHARTKRDLRRPVMESWQRLAEPHDRETSRPSRPEIRPRCAAIRRALPYFSDPRGADFTMLSSAVACTKSAR